MHKLKTAPRCRSRYAIAGNHLVGAWAQLSVRLFRLQGSLLFDSDAARTDVPFLRAFDPSAQNLDPFVCQLIKRKARARSEDGSIFAEGIRLWIERLKLCIPIGEPSALRCLKLPDELYVTLVLAEDLLKYFVQLRFGFLILLTRFLVRDMLGLRFRDRTANDQRTD